MSLGFWKEHPGREIAQVCLIKIPPSQWKESILLLQIRRGEKEHQARVLS
jgi:hypothetical protein